LPPRTDPRAGGRRQSPVRLARLRQWRPDPDRPEPAPYRPQRHERVADHGSQRRAVTRSVARALRRGWGV